MVPSPSSAPALAPELRVGVLRLARRLRLERRDATVTDSQFAVLAVLERDGAATPGALAEYERVQPPSMTRTVAALEAAGLVERAPHPGDRRQVLVQITPAGRAEVRETRRRRDAWLAVRLAALDPADRALLAQAADLLSRIARS